MKLIKYFLIMILLLQTIFYSNTRRIRKSKTKGMEEIREKISVLENLSENELKELQVLLTAEFKKASRQKNQDIMNEIDSYSSKINTILVQKAGGQQKKENDKKLLMTSYLDFNKNLVPPRVIYDLENNTEVMNRHRFVEMGEWASYNRGVNLPENIYLLTDACATCVCLVAISDNRIILTHIEDREDIDNLNIFRYTDETPDQNLGELMTSPQWHESEKDLLEDFKNMNANLTQKGLSPVKNKFFNQELLLFRRIGNIFNQFQDGEAINIYLSTSLGKNSSYIPLIIRMVNYRLLNNRRNFNVFKSSDSICVSLNNGNVSSKCTKTVRIQNDVVIEGLEVNNL